MQTMNFLGMANPVTIHGLDRGGILLNRLITGEAIDELMEQGSDGFLSLYFI